MEVKADPDTRQATLIRRLREAVIRAYRTVWRGRRRYVEIEGVIGEDES